LNKPKVVTLCGSSRFVDVMAVSAWLLEKEEGAITMGLHLLPWWYGGKKDHLAEHEGVADIMDNLHLRKIDLSAEIFVVNCNNYTGLSTNREIAYAVNKGIPVRYYMEDPIGEKVDILIHAALKREREKADAEGREED